MQIVMDEAFLMTEMLSQFPNVHYHAVMNDVDDSYAYKFANGCLHIATKLPGLSHEVAHMLEMSNLERLLLLDMGMENPGFPVVKPFKISWLAREIRVHAIQHVMQDPCARRIIHKQEGWIPRAVRQLPYGKFKSESDLLDWESDIHHRTLRNWSQDRIMFEWSVRINFLKSFC